jgi:lon-related putative ATP-dependent protease
MKRHRYRLSAKDLTHTLPRDWLPFPRTTAELKPFKGIIGQNRAMRAIEIGLKIPTRGFNIFAAGEAGSGKTSTLVRLLTSRAAGEPTPPDLCYVNNFTFPNQPRPIQLPAGQGRQFAKAMDRLVTELSKMVPRVLSDEAFGHVRSKILAETHARAQVLTRRTAQEASRLGLSIEEGEQALRVLPVVNDEPVEQEAFQKLPAALRRRIEESLLAFQKHLDLYSYQRQQLELDHIERMTRAEAQAIAPLVTELLRSLTRFRKLDGAVGEFLDEVQAHVLEHYEEFQELAGAEEEEVAEGAGDPLAVYRVNVVVDRTGERGAPVVMEQVPSPANLCGCFEYRTEGGRLVTDHTMIRAGCLHQANGGYLLLQIDDLVSQANAWDCLKRALRHKQIRIEEEAAPGERRTRLAGAMKPEAVPLRVKVVLVGPYDAYYILKLEDSDFGRLFKILAEFEPTMPRTRQNVRRLARFLGQVCREEGYLPIHRSGMARIVEVASRLAEHKEQMTTQWAPLLDLVAEADCLARGQRARAIRDRDVDHALAEGRRRSGAAASMVDRAIGDGTILIRTRSAVVGQINGIALYDLAGASFGVPVRITVRVYAGRRGVVNIDREVNLSGAIHDKGALILVGYLGGRYAQDHTLGLSASVTFEQSYDEIDGDSASCAELYALLSALSGCPIRQGIAVTGSVNQVGEVQPIGGVNEKIEGIFRVCKHRGLTGDEGVMIPRANVKHLMLDREVIQAVRAKKFHIYAIATIDEGIEVLTGLPAGKENKNGRWTPDSINDRVARRLEELQQVAQQGVSTALDQKL